MASAVQELTIVPIVVILDADGKARDKRNQICGSLGIPQVVYAEWNRRINLETKSYYDFFNAMLEEWVDIKKLAGQTATNQAFVKILRTNTLGLGAAAEKIENLGQAAPKKTVPITCSVNCGIDSDVYFTLPCGHFVCQSCKDRIESCPICRGVIAPLVRLYP